MTFKERDDKLKAIEEKLDRILKLLLIGNASTAPTLSQEWDKFRQDLTGIVSPCVVVAFSKETQREGEDDDEQVYLTGYLTRVGGGENEDFKNECNWADIHNARRTGTFKDGLSAFVFFRNRAMSADLTLDLPSYADDWVVGVQPLAGTFRQLFAPPAVNKILTARSCNKENKK